MTPFFTSPIAKDFSLSPMCLDAGWMNAIESSKQASYIILYLMRLYVNSDDLHHVKVGGLSLAGSTTAVNC